MAQESNWSQASWHAPPGVAGDPLIADYYGAGGGIDSIDYADADCGYGISQVTDGMAVGDTHAVGARPDQGRGRLPGEHRGRPADPRIDLEPALLRRDHRQRR